MWYNLPYTGLAYVFVKCTANGGAVSFSYGSVPVFQSYVIYIACGSAGVVFLGCVFVCCCYVRKIQKKRSEDKVKKYGGKVSTMKEKISKFKYGREKAPIEFPDIGENEDEMQKPNDEWGTPGYGEYDGQEGLDFQQLEEPTNYQFNGGRP